MTPPAIVVPADGFNIDLMQAGRRRGFAPAAAVLVGPGSKRHISEVVAIGPGAVAPLTAARRAMQSGQTIALLFGDVDAASAAAAEINRELSPEGGA